MKIEEILAKRTDLSTFLVHLTRSVNGEEPLENLSSLLKDWVIKAKRPQGLAVARANDLKEKKKISTSFRFPKMRVLY